MQHIDKEYPDAELEEVCEYLNISEDGFIPSTHYPIFLARRARDHVIAQYMCAEEAQHILDEQKKVDKDNT